MQHQDLYGLLQPWSTKTLQELRTLYVHLKRHNRTMEEFVAYMDQAALHRRAEEERMRKARDEYVKKLPKCPDCGAPMYPYPVNTTPRNRVGGPWKTQWICANTDCLREEYDRRTVDELMKEAT